MGRMQMHERRRTQEGEDQEEGARGVRTAATVKKRLLERVDLLAQGHVLALHAAQFSADRIDEPVTVCDIALERGDVLYSS